MNALVHPAAAVALLVADDALTSAIETLRQHQENHARILRLRNEAQQLEDRVKGIVRDIEGFEKEIRTACGDNEIDYKLLLDFARRISKYNHEAAADAATGALERQEQGNALADKDVTMTGTDGKQPTEGAEPVASVTKNATQWLDESANVTRQERIRMGLMGQIQLTASNDPEKEVERLLREAEGLGAAEPPAPVEPAESTKQAGEAAKAAVQAGSSPPECCGRMLQHWHRNQNPRRCWTLISTTPTKMMIECFKSGRCIRILQTACYTEELKNRLLPLKNRLLKNRLLPLKNRLLPLKNACYHEEPPATAEERLLLKNRC
ncbi:hypothetical protein PDIDSM_1172 [Penicillium digitatum]|nr:hypothetical protein PDIDSM_1172 [Penicillium digitatum]